MVYVIADYLIRKSKRLSTVPMKNAYVIRFAEIHTYDYICTCMITVVSQN